MTQHLLQVEEHLLGRPRICLAPEPLRGQMVRELSTPTTAAVRLTGLVDARQLGRLVEEPLLQVMHLVLDHVRRLTVEATAGAQDPRHLLGESPRRLQEPVAAMHGVQARTMPLLPAAHSVPQLLVL